MDLRKMFAILVEDSSDTFPSFCCIKDKEESDAITPVSVTTWEFVDAMDCGGSVAVVEDIVAWICCKSSSFHLGALDIPDW